MSFSGQYAPSPHAVNRNDVAFFYYNASWSDTRSAGSASATHQYHMKIQWAVTNQREAWYNVTTQGSTSGSHQFSVNLTLDFAYVVDIRWDARVFSGPTCDSTVVSDLPVTVVFQFP